MAIRFRNPYQRITNVGWPNDVPDYLQILLVMPFHDGTFGQNQGYDGGTIVTEYSALYYDEILGFAEAEVKISPSVQYWINNNNFTLSDPPITVNGIAEGIKHINFPSGDKSMQPFDPRHDDSLWYIDDTTARYNWTFGAELGDIYPKLYTLNAGQTNTKFREFTDIVFEILGRDLNLFDRLYYNGPGGSAFYVYEGGDPTADLYPIHSESIITGPVSAVYLGQNFEAIGAYLPDMEHSTSSEGYGTVTINRTQYIYILLQRATG